jgi:iron complex transport system substrate-binding protein
MRICSLLPGATEVVAALGAAGELVGISHECDYPPEVRKAPVMVRPVIDSDRLSSPDIDRQVKAAVESGKELYVLDESLFTRSAPDLVITQDLCRVCAITPGQLQRAIDALPHPPQLLALDPVTLEEIIHDVERIGGAIGRSAEGRALAEQLRARLRAVSQKIARRDRTPQVVCLEWLDPLYVGGHWVPDMVARAGGRDMLGTAGERSKKVTWDQVLDARPDVLVLMPCSFSAERTLREVHRVTSRPGWHSLPAVQNGQVYAVDSSSYFSRPSHRLVEGVEILAALIHPSLFDKRPPGVRRVEPDPPSLR